MIASWLAGQPLAEWKREHFGRVPYVKPDSASSAVPLLDCKDVFIVQTSGSKDYRLRANTVNPRPTIDAMPRDMRFELERTPVIACTLLPGDWLYVPRGFWHVAHARDDSLSLSIGVLTPQARGARPARAPAALRRSRVSS
jgi:ribosomal protein L16 Arg81 hydroxylase